MKAMSWLRGRKGTVAGAAVVTVGAIALTTFAVAYEGNPTAEVELDDGSVWVTKTSAEVMGHLNTESTLLDGQLRGISSDQVSVMQSGDDIFAHDRGDNTLSRVDGAAMVLGERVTLEAGSSVAQAASTIAILAPGAGGLHVMSADEMGSFSVEESDAFVEVGSDAVVTVGLDGSVHAFSPESATLTTIETGTDGAPAGEPIERTIEGVSAGDDVQLSTVGATPVILDRTEGYVLSPDGLQASIGTGEGMQLAADAPEGTTVRVATSDSIITVPLDGAEPTAVSAGAEGEAVTPVVVEGCVYGAWRGANQAVRDCPGTDNDFARALENAGGDALLELRANRDDVVINDRAGGGSWVATDGLAYVNNWDDLTPPEGDDQESDEVEQSDATEVQPPDRTKDNRDPIAENDEYGVRAGRSAVLPVLDNDSDEDGDLLTITIEAQPEFGVVEPIQDGKALQITMPGGAAANSTGSFTYKVSDGRGGSDTARVAFEVHPPEQNEAPRQKPLQPTVAVETGGSVTYNVLPDWIDPDGDDIFLAAVTPAEGDEVTFTADGQITYEARSGYQGPLDIDVSVSDGQVQASGSLALDVRPVGTVRPVTNADHAVLYEGDTATVEPLQNDINAASEELRLGTVAQASGLDIVVDTQNSTFDVTGLEAGTYYIDYVASAGAQSSPGLVRIDVHEKSDISDDPPVAVRDTAYLPGGGEVLVDVLQNDHDPAGGVLVVQSVTAPSGSGVSASVLGHSTVQLTDRAMLSEQVVVTYNIHNGSHSATGEIIVIPVPATDKIQPPVAEDDTAVVRAGDIVTLPVTDNDFHPNGQAFSVAPELIEAPDSELGEMFIAQDTVRFRAAEDASGQASAVYEIVDEKGQKSAALITVNITPWSEENNSAPVARTVTARAIAGTETRIEIPMESIDPDGDMVDLIGISSAPGKGRISERGADYFTYEAYRDAAGVDTFRYRVADTFGEEAVGTVRVGVAPPEAVNQPPNAMSDEVAMRPGRTVSVPVLANDSDPDGDKFGLVNDGITLNDESSGVQVRESGADRVLVTAPGRELTTQFQYTIEDEYGNPSQGAVSVTVADDVPLETPIARDDRVLIDMVTGDFTADIDLFDNDEDPDGTTDDLALDIDRVEPLPAKGPGWVRVAIEERRQTIAYTVADVDGNETSAFLIVPAKDDLRPVLKEDALITAPSNELIEIPLEDYVTVAEGLDVRITTADSVTANHDDGTALVKDQTTLQYKSEYRYMGADDITFEVTDGDSPDDPNGRKSVITIPINVLQPENEPPEFTNTTMTVGAGDGAVTVDLAQRTFDIDEDPIAYSLTSAVPDGISASISGTALTVEASPETRGLAPVIDVALSDGENDPVGGQVMLSVTASTRPLPSAPNVELGEIHQGQTQEIGVTGDAFNPFDGEGPLHVVSAVLEAGDATVSSSDSSVTVTPGADFHGYLTVRYTLGDLTNDPDRYVQGRITGTVLGVPETPGTPTASEVGNRTATLSWRAPSNNGAEIQVYEVASTDGSYATECRTTVCRLDGLTNNHVYNFTVTAINEVGPSPASSPSGDVRPDVKPEAPQAPQFTLSDGERDQRLGIRWNRPDNEGSPIRGYYVRVESDQGIKLHEFGNSTATSRVFERLANGQKYRFQVAAINSADIRSADDWSWSPWSGWEHPATVPDPAGKPVATIQGDRGYGENQFTVTWDRGSSDGGDPISKWRIRILRDGDEFKTIERSGSGTSTSIAIPTSTANYTFQIAGVNREGQGKFGAASEPVRSFSKPGPVESVSAAASDNAVKVRWSPVDPNGARGDELSYQFSVRGGGWQAVTGVSSEGDTLVARVAATNGQPTTVSIRAVSSIDGGAALAGDAGTSHEVTPFGPIDPPTAVVSADSSHAGDFKVDLAAQGNGRPIRRVEWNVVAQQSGLSSDGSTERSHATVNLHDGRDWIGLIPGEAVNVHVVAIDSEGQTSSATISLRVPAPSFDTPTVSGESVTMAFRNLVPSDLYGWFYEYDYTCQVNDGGWDDIGRGNFADKGSSGSFTVDCFDKRHFDDRSYRVVLHPQDGIPGGFTSAPVKLPKPAASS